MRPQLKICRRFEVFEDELEVLSVATEQESGFGLCFGWSDLDCKPWIRESFAGVNTILCWHSDRATTRYSYFSPRHQTS